VRVLLSTLALLTTVAAASPQTSSTGCVGAPVAACVASLRASMTLEEGQLADALAQRRRTDVNGRGVAALFGRLPGRPDLVKIVLALTPDDRVKAAAATLPHDPRRARTEEEYAETGVYELAQRLAGARCPDPSPLAFYRFFENAVKPRIAVSRQDLRGAFAGGHRELALAERVPYCGVFVNYTGSRSWSGADDWYFAAKVQETRTIEFAQ